uniref:RxLR effector candidate protein n=1 Tax=Hyaloperonospora arabidopsidis (strain Emoy2) TaxID=559515 RepID=M4BS03_HYAAE
MYHGIKSLQSLYKSAGRSFDYGPPSTKGGSRHTARRDRAHPSSAGIGAPSCSTRVDTPAIGRDNSSLILNRYGGSRYAPQGSVDHRVSPPKEAAEKEKPPPSRSTHHLDPHEMDRAIVQLHEDLEHERYRRYALADLVREHCKDRTDYALAQLQIERDVRSLGDELATARQEISRVNGEVSSLRDQTDRLEHKRKNLMEILEHGGYLHRRKRARTDSMGGDAPPKT